MNHSYFLCIQSDVIEVYSHFGRNRKKFCLLQSLFIKYSQQMHLFVRASSAREEWLGKAQFRRMSFTKLDSNEKQENCSRRVPIMYIVQEKKTTVFNEPLYFD